MAKRRRPLPVLEGSQAAAVDPGAFVTLSASAGTGKTQVLTGRVLRLLLSGAAPETILCLTFTKAGAAEMANRIGGQLASWVRMPENDLKKDLFALGERDDPLVRQRARRLFAKVLDAPGGLRIQTIHSFAQALLASFPEEAGIAPGFRPIEGRAEQELARTTLANLLADAEAGGNAGLIADVQRLSLRSGEDGAVAYLMRCARAAEAMAAFGLPATIERLLRRLMDLPEESLDEYLAQNCGDDRFDCDLLRAIADANRRWAKPTGDKVVEMVDRWLAMDGPARAQALPDLALVVFTGGGELRKVTAGQRSADLDYDRHAERLAEAIGELLRIQNGARLAADMGAGLRAGQAFAAAYTAAKRSAGVADFDDLIAWTRRLLSQPGIGEWVRFKLDRRTDHVLVDESQDTNRAQWDIVQALAAEYFSGSSEADERHRTIFMVGDFKQAIFRFQGTDPGEFKRAADWVRDNSEALRQAALGHDEPWSPPEYRDLSIESSFRSAPAILDIVDAVIAEVGPEAMGLPDEPNQHRAFFDGRPGEVVLLKPFAVEDGGDEEGEEGWLGEDARLYAGELAREVRRWLDDKPVLATTRRPLSAGDILILVRSRAEMASLIVARLFEEGVPVAGIDRLHLHKPLAVKDLLAAVQFAVQPLDDLNLANLLVSPLLGWDQELLRDLAHSRKLPLWSALVARSAEKPEFADAREVLGSLLAMADYTTPHRFLETILSGPIDGRRKLYGRLGQAARDPVEELLSSALDFERSEAASLDRFLAWFNTGEVEIKRDPSAPANAVRVMTVHGAKGLEAPVVLLADATADPSRLGGPARTLDFPIPGVGKAPLLRPRKAERAPPFDALMDAEDIADLQEHWRLLYVALTRASERLVIAGLDTSNARGEMPENCWHVRVGRALARLGALPQPQGSWDAMVYRGTVPAATVRPKAAPTPVPAPALPAWARSPAPVEARPPRPLAPSAIIDGNLPSPPPGPAQAESARRGILLHRLFERLPAVEVALRHDAALRWLERSAGVADPAQRSDLADAACDIIANPAFADLFGPSSLAEAPIAATLDDGRVIAGTVDRLLVEPGRIRVVDFKTGTRVPGSQADVPRSHIAQMQAYAEALRVIFPEHEVEASLLYTAGPSLVTITC